MDESIWTGIIIIAIIFFAGIAAWLGEEFRKWKIRQKRKASQPIDATNWLVYDNKAEIKQLGHELRKISYERWKTDESNRNYKAD